MTFADEKDWNKAERLAVAAAVAPTLRSQSDKAKARRVALVDAEGKVTGYSTLGEVQKSLLKAREIELEVADGVRPKEVICRACGKTVKVPRKGGIPAACMKSCATCADCGKSIYRKKGRDRSDRFCHSCTAIRWQASRTSDQRKDSARKAQAAMTPGKKSKALRSAHAARTPEQKEEIARKLREANAARTPEQNAEYARLSLEAWTIECRREMTRKWQSARTPEQKKESARKRLAALTPEQRAEAARKRQAAFTPEQRSEQMRKAWETRRAKKAAAVAAERSDCQETESK